MYIFLVLGNKLNQQVLNTCTVLTAQNNISIIYEQYYQMLERM